MSCSDHGSLQTRRQSIQQAILPGRTGSQPSLRSALRTSTFSYPSTSQNRSSRLSRVHQASDNEEIEIPDDRTPLVGTSHADNTSPPRALGGYGGTVRGGSPNGGRFGGLFRRQSEASSKSSRRPALERRKTYEEEDYDVNNPPSIPSSPQLDPDLHYGSILLTPDEIELGRSPDQNRTGETLIDIDHDDGRCLSSQSKSASSLHEDLSLHRRMTLRAEDDVCFPQEGLSDLAEEDFQPPADRASYRIRRRRSRKWPDLSFLEEWAIGEKEQRTLEGIRARQVSEPLMIGGRLRPSKTDWHRQEDDNPFRFTYFNEEFESTIHAQSISELLQPGQTFKDLFIPEPPLLSEDSSEDEVILPQHISDNMSDRQTPVRSPVSVTTPFRNDSTTITSRLSEYPRQSGSGQNTGQNTPLQQPVKPQRHGPRPVFWLDVLCPTDAEMKVLSKTFAIHPLTAEDIMMQEAREKVELFRNYYFVNYRSFEQDTNSDSYMAPVNMYVVVFREGVISFHFSQTPHPANVRRRIRQLSDYLFLTTDWISYAIIDDVTDAYAPLIERIEQEVDDIDEAILTLHSEAENSSSDDNAWKRWRDKFLEYEKLSTYSDDGKEKEKDKMMGSTGVYMLRRVGETRKKVMSLYRLLGNKADVIKGFAKRCNEQWEVAPRSEIGLYLGDIQDHIVTMTGNLSHYENLLSRAHSNYLAQINLRMNSRAEKTNDVLGKLTVLGTIVLPMNIVTGMWGMNVLVPVSLHSLSVHLPLMND